jgi:hypothetical protein
MLKGLVLAASVAAASAFAPMAGVLPKSSREYPEKISHLLVPGMAKRKHEWEDMQRGIFYQLAWRCICFFAARFNAEAQEAALSPSSCS